MNELYAAGGDQALVRRLLEERGVDEGKRVVAYCHSGQRSEIAAALLRAAGVDAVNYAGSWHEWSRRGRRASWFPPPRRNRPHSSRPKSFHPAISSSV